MRSQWECLLQNLGEWHGSFSELSAQGELIKDTPTVISLEALNNCQTIRHVIRRLPPDQQIEEQILEYSSLGRGVLFFDNGAFSQGSIQLSPVSEFGAELGLIYGERRLRLVQLFAKNGQFDKLILIREKLAGTTIVERPHFAVDDLLGQWQGEAVTIYPDLRSPSTDHTTLQITKNGNEQIVQQLTINQPDSTFNISSTGKIQGNLIYFDSSSQPVQVLLLPNGASATFPLELKSHQPFFLEIGWLQQPNLRQRLIRRYNAAGEWSNLTLVTEHKT